MKSNVILLFSTTFFCFIFTEIYLRNNVDTLHIEDTDSQYKFYKYDPMLGWVNNPNRFGKLIRNEFVNKISINSQGMRDREIDLGSNKKKIAVIGDSFTWGIGVDIEERYTELIQTLSEFDVLNFGVSGYGPLQHYLNLGKIIKFKPDLVVLQFCLNNDLLDNIFWKRYGYYKPYVVESSLNVLGKPIPNAREFALDTRFDNLLEKSKVYFLLKSFLKNNLNQHTNSSTQKGLLGLSEIGHDLYFPQESKNLDLVKKTYEINENILLQIKQVLEKNNIKFLVLVTPSKCELGLCFKDRKDPNFVVYSEIIKTLDKLSLPYIDPVMDFSKDDFWKYDGHWRASGHRKISKKVLDWLQNNNF